jgi:hypothetical protein
LELHRNSNEINKYFYYSHFLKRKTKTPIGPLPPFSLRLGPTARSSCNAPALARARARAAHQRAAHPHGLLTRALSLSLFLSLTRGPHLSSPSSALSLSPATRPCPHGGRPVITASVTQLSCSTASPLHGDPILLPSGNATTSGGPSRRPWRTGGHGDRCPGGLLR